MGLKESFSKFFKKQTSEENVEERISRLGIDVVSDRKLSDRINLINEMLDAIESPLESDNVYDRIEEIKERLQFVNRGLKIIAVPYGRAGDNVVYREAMRGWETLYSVSIDIIELVRDMVYSALMNKTEFVSIVDWEKMDENTKKILQVLERNKLIKIEDKQLVQVLADGRTQVMPVQTYKINVQELERKLRSFLRIEIYPYAFLIMDISFYSKDVAPAYTTVIQTLGPIQRQIPYGWEAGLEPKKREE